MKDKIKTLLHLICPIFMTKYYYKKVLKKTLDLNNPKTLNEKINWLKLNYWPKIELSKIVADKYQVRNYVKECGCEKILNELIGVWDNTKEINWEDLPNKFAIKCGHGCGMNIICFDKNKMDKEQVFKKLEKWLKIDFGKKSCEPHYSKIKPKIICEKFIGSHKSLPDDIKIHCFHGEPALIAYYSEREKDLHASFYDIEWNNLEISTKKGKIIPKPKCLNEMLEICRKLTKSLVYARIDFYIYNGGIIFGEITLTPASGRSPYFTEEADLKYGHLLDLKKCKIDQRIQL